MSFWQSVFLELLVLFSDSYKIFLVHSLNVTYTITSTKATALLYNILLGQCFTIERHNGFVAKVTAVMSKKYHVS
jgi:hypothetical protein